MMLLKIRKHLRKRGPLFGPKRASQSSERRKRELTHHTQRPARADPQDVARLKVERTPSLILGHRREDLRRVSTIGEQGSQHRTGAGPDIDIKVVRQGAASQFVKCG